MNFNRLTSCKNLIKRYSLFRASVSIKDSPLLHYYSTSSSNTPKNILTDYIISNLNDRLKKYKMTSFITFQLSKIGFYLPLCAIFILLGVDYPILALSSAIVSITKRFRLPVSISIAAILHKLVPKLSTIKMSYVLIPPNTHQNTTSRVTSRVSDKFIKFLEGPIDKYGASLFVAKIITGLTHMTLTYTLIKLAGITDIASLAEYFHVQDQSITKMLERWYLLWCNDYGTYYQ